MCIENKKDISKEDIEENNFIIESDEESTDDESQLIPANTCITVKLGCVYNLFDNDLYCVDCQPENFNHVQGYMSEKWTCTCNNNLISVLQKLICQNCASKLYEITYYYSENPEHPEGENCNEEFDLPGINSLECFEVMFDSDSD